MAKERKPDLNDPDESLEKHIEEMMEPEKPKPAPASKRIQISHHTDDPPSAPELPKKGVSISVVDHNEAEEAPVKPDKAPDVNDTIEEVNEQLQSGISIDEPKLEVIPEEPQVEDPSEEDLVIEDVDDTAEDVADETPEIETEPEKDDSETLAEPEEPAAEDKIEESETETETDEVPAEEELPSEPETPDEDTPDEPLKEDKAVDEAVDDIIARESDALLEAEDEKLAAAFDSHKPSFRERLIGFLWHNKAVRITLLLLLIGGAVAAAIVPTSRYFVLNSFGVRSSASLTSIDDSTQQPLKNVMVLLAGQSTQTDKQGKVSLQKLKLGRQELVIEKRAFAPVKKSLTVGWGSNPLGDIKLTPVGTQYVFEATDYLSGKPVGKVESISGEASAVSDDKGLIRLTLDKEESAKLEELQVVIKAEGYREEKLTLDADTKEVQKLRLVAERKHAFITKRSGKYDVYTIDVDGKNEKLLLAGTGSEREDMVLVPHPTTDVVALVSTRDNKRNKDGFLLSNLTVIDIKSGDTKSVTTSERIQIIDWIGNRLVYVQIASGASTANPKRHRLMSYDQSTESSKELASSNYFNDVLVAGGKVFYAPSSAYSGGINSSLFRIDADGSNRQVALGEEVWSLFRASYEQLILSLQQQWFEYKLGEGKAAKLSGEPANLTSRVYVDSPDHKRSLWVDTRDGKGVLLAYDIATKQDTILRSQSGLKNPVHWLNNTTIVFRIHNDQETADYAISLDGGEPVKIRDVTNTDGVDRWYYY